MGLTRFTPLSVAAKREGLNPYGTPAAEAAYLVGPVPPFKNGEEARVAYATPQDDDAPLLVAVGGNGVTVVTVTGGDDELTTQVALTLPYPPGYPQTGADRYTIDGDNLMLKRITFRFDRYDIAEGFMRYAVEGGVNAFITEGDLTAVHVEVDYDNLGFFDDLHRVASEYCGDPN